MDDKVKKLSLTSSVKKDSKSESVEHDNNLMLGFGGLLDSFDDADQTEDDESSSSSDNDDKLRDRDKEKDLHREMLKKKRHAEIETSNNIAI